MVMNRSIVFCQEFVDIQIRHQGSLTVPASRGTPQNVAGMPVFRPAVIRFLPAQLQGSPLSVGPVRPEGSRTGTNGMDQAVVVVIKAQLLSPGAETEGQAAGKAKSNQK